MKYLVVILLCLAIGQTRAQTIALSLNDAIQIALQNNFDIRLSTIDQTIAEHQNTKGNAGFLPNISIQNQLLGHYSNTNNPLDFAAGKLNTLTDDIVLKANWTLFGGFRAVATKKLLAHTVGSSKLQAKMIVEGTIQSTLLTYYQAQLQKNQIDILINQFDYSKNKKGLAEKQFKQGVIDNFEYQTITHNYWADSASLLQSKLTHQQLIADLKQICVIVDSSKITLSDSLPSNFKNYDFNELVQQIQSNNARLQLENTYLHIKSAKIEQSKSYQYPTLLATAQTNYLKGAIDHDIFGSANANETNVYIGLTLNFDLWRGGQVQNQIKTSKLNFEQQQVRVERVRFDLFNKLRKTLTTYNQLIQTLKVKQQKLQASETLMKIAQKRYNHGVIDSRNWQEIKLGYLQDQADCLLITYQIIQQESELIRISGGILTDNAPFR